MTCCSRQITSLKTQNVSFFTFYNLILFGELQIPFREYLMQSPARKVSRFPVNLGLNYTYVRTIKFFSPAES